MENIMKKVIPSLIALCSICSAYALKFEYNGIWYDTNTNVYPPQGNVSVCSQSLDWQASSYSGDITIPEKVIYYPFPDNPLASDVYYEYTVTGIAASAFAGDADLRSVTLPSTITSIGQGAFGQCGIESISLPTGVNTIAPYAFNACKSLKTANIPGATRIESQAFTGCESLENITFGNLTYIGDYAFSNCGFKEFTVPESVTYIDSGAFQNCASLEKLYYNPANCEINTTVSYPMFSGCKKFTTLIFGDKVQVIPQCTFAFCSNLNKIVFPESLKTIGSYAFRGCYRLRSIIFPSSLLAIDSGAFYDCNHLRFVTSFNLTPPAVGANAFYCLNEFATLYVPRKSLVDYRQASGWNVFYRVVRGFKDKAFLYEEDEENEGQVTLVDYDDYLAQTIAIPQTVTNNGSTFTVTAVGAKDNYAGPFENCASVTAASIPSTVTKINLKAFWGCTSLMHLECHATVPPTAAEEAFMDVPTDCVLYVPDGRIDSYKERSGWSRFFTIKGDVETIHNDSPQVSVDNGVLTVRNATSDTPIEVFSVTGQIIYKGFRTTIALPSGIYIIRIAGNSKKVIV